MTGSPELSTYPWDDKDIFELQEVCLMRFEGSIPYYPSFGDFLIAVREGVLHRNLQSQLPSTFAALNAALFEELSRTETQFSKANAGLLPQVQQDSGNGVANTPLRSPYQAGRSPERFFVADKHTLQSELLAAIRRNHQKAPLSRFGFSVATGVEKYSSSLDSYLHQRMNDLQKAGVTGLLFELIAIEISAFTEFALHAVEPLAKLLNPTISTMTFGPNTGQDSPDELWMRKIKVASAALGCIHAAQEYIFEHEAVFGGNAELPRPWFLWKALLYAQNPRRYERKDLVRLASYKQKIYHLLNEGKFKEALVMLEKLTRDNMFEGVINQYFVEKALTPKQL